MQYTAQQTAERLGITVSQVRTRMYRGDLHDVSPKAGQGKHTLWFDAKEVEEARKAMKSNGHYYHPPATAPVPPATPLFDAPEAPGPLGTLGRIEERLKVLAATPPVSTERIDTRLAAINDSLDRIGTTLELLLAAWK